MRSKSFTFDLIIVFAEGEYDYIVSPLCDEMLYGVPPPAAPESAVYTVVKIVLTFWPRN